MHKPQLSKLMTDESAHNTGQHAVPPLTHHGRGIVGTEVRVTLCGEATGLVGGGTDDHGQRLRAFAAHSMHVRVLGVDTL